MLQFVVRTFIHLTNVYRASPVCQVWSCPPGGAKLTKSWSLPASSESFHSSRKRQARNNKHDNEVHNVAKWYSAVERKESGWGWECRIGGSWGLSWGALERSRLQDVGLRGEEVGRGVVRTCGDSLPVVSVFFS